MAGQSVWIGFGSFVVSRYVIRKKAIRVLSLYLLAGGLVFTAGRLSETVTERAAMTSAKKALRDLIPVAEGVLQDSQPSPALQSKDPLAELVSEFMKDVDRETMIYATKLQQLNLERMVSPPALADASVTAANIAKLQDFKKTQETCFQKLKEMQETLRRRFMDTKTPLADSQRFKTSVFNSFQESIGAVEQVFECRRETIELDLAMLSSAQTHRADLSFADGKVRLLNYDLVQEYNGLILQASSVAAREQQLQQRYQEDKARLQQKVEDAKQLLK
jgi:hypothetical protein